jgi:hypothetical protein
MVAALLAAADDRIGSMFVFFFIALLIVAPFGWKRLAPVLRERRARNAPPEAEEATPTEPDPNDAATLVALVERAAEELAPGGTCDVDVPPDATIDGRPAPRQLVETLLADAARRRSLAVDWTPDGKARLTKDPRG